MPKPTNKIYDRLFAEIISHASIVKPFWFEDVLNDSRLPDVSLETKKKHLRSYIESNPSYLEKIQGFYPSAPTIISLVELKLGTEILEKNLDESNKIAREIVRNVTSPIIERFISSGLSAKIKNTSLTIDLPELIEFLAEDFSEFLSAQGNGLVSIAGTVNEYLLSRAMINGGMTEQNFQKTGKNSDADFMIYSSAASRYQIGIEVKSYHARERLLRGLQDIEGNKIGFGYFINPQEFNAHRTKTLLQTEAMAIYMPAKTLSKIEPEAKNLTTNSKIAFGSKFYRPFEQFVTDMKYFCLNGKLPTF
jgi:hypothetical protein